MCCFFRWTSILCSSLLCWWVTSEQQKCFNFSNKTCVLGPVSVLQNGKNTVNGMVGRREEEASLLMTVQCSARALDSIPASLVWFSCDTEKLKAYITVLLASYQFIIIWVPVWNAWPLRHATNFIIAWSVCKAKYSENSARHLKSINSFHSRRYTSSPPVFFIKWSSR